MLPEHCEVRLLIEPDESRFDEDDYRVHKGELGVVLSASKGANGGPNWYVVEFMHPDTTDGLWCKLLHLREDEIELVRTFE